MIKVNNVLLGCIGALVVCSGCSSTPTIREEFDKQKKPDCASCQAAACEYSRGVTEPVGDNPPLEAYINDFIKICEQLKASGCPISEDNCNQGKASTTDPVRLP